MTKTIEELQKQIELQKLNEGVEGLSSQKAIIIP